MLYCHLPMSFCICREYIRNDAPVFVISWEERITCWICFRKVWVLVMDRLVIFCSAFWMYIYSSVVAEFKNFDKSLLWVMLDQIHLFLLSKSKSCFHSKNFVRISFHPIMHNNLYVEIKIQSKISISKKDIWKKSLYNKVSSRIT